jgi:hypothetical protein
MVRKEEFMKLHPEVRTGMEAYNFKGERFGIIERIDDDSITIEKGHIFRHEVSLPYDAIEDIREDHVIIRPSAGFEEGQQIKSESREEPERQHERERSAREELFQFEREEMLERESAPGAMEKEETRMGMSEGLEEGEWQESPRREAGLEEADIGSRARAGSGWEERESAWSEEEVRVPVREEEVEVTKKAVGKEEAKVEPSENVQKKERTRSRGR